MRNFERSNAFSTRDICREPINQGENAAETWGFLRDAGTHRIDPPMADGIGVSARPRRRR